MTPKKAKRPWLLDEVRILLRKVTAKNLLPLVGVGDLLEVTLDDAAVVVAVAGPEILDDARAELAGELAPGLAGEGLQVGFRDRPGWSGAARESFGGLAG